MGKKTYFIGFIFVLWTIIFMTTTQAGLAAVVKVVIGAPTTFKVTVTKVEVHNGTTWVSLFSGSSQLDLVSNPGDFPGISDLTFPPATYSQLRVTFLNSFSFKGQLDYLGTTYYTTSTTLNDDTASLASTTGPAQECTVRNPDWGVLGAEVVKTWDIGPITVTASTDYQPILNFDVSRSLMLFSGPDETKYFLLQTPDPAIIEAIF